MARQFYYRREKSSWAIKCIWLHAH
jgi:hypothetical protein